VAWRQPSEFFRRYPITVERVRAAIVAAGYPAGGPPRGGPPAVVVLPQPGNPGILGTGRPVIGGRYFPEMHAAGVYAHPRAEVTAATVGHELAHAAGHAGHDAAFYAALEGIHRARGTPTWAARMVEEEGRYAFPESWRGGEWRARPSVGKSLGKSGMSVETGRWLYVDQNGQTWRVEDTAKSSGIGSTAWAGSDLRWVGSIGRAAYGMYESGAFFDELGIGVWFRAPSEHALEARIDGFAETHAPRSEPKQAPPSPAPKTEAGPGEPDGRPTGGSPTPQTSGGGGGTLLLVGAAAVVAWLLIA